MSRAFYPGSGVTLNVKFGDVAHELLTDFLAHLNSLNKKKLFTLDDCSDCFKDPRLMGGLKAAPPFRLPVRPPVGSRSMNRCHVVAGYQYLKKTRF